RSGMPSCRLPRSSRPGIISTYRAPIISYTSGVRAAMTLQPSRLTATRAAVAVALCLLATRSDAAEVKLARHPDYHNGKIVFSYPGDLWTANEDGSAPQRLTVHRSRDIHPRFSPDGKWIAFSSDRYGNYDVFVIPATGGKAKRLTFHSASDTVVGWTPDS